MRQSRYRTFTSLQKIILHGTRLQRFPNPTLDVSATGKNLRNEIYAHHSTQPYWCSMMFNTDIIFQRLLQGFHCSESLGNTLPEDSNSLARPDNCHPPLLRFLSISFFCLFWLRVSLWSFNTLLHGKKKFVVDGPENFKVISNKLTNVGCRFHGIHCHHKLLSETNGRLGTRHIPLECAFLPMRV